MAPQKAAREVLPQILPPSVVQTQRDARGPRRAYGVRGMWGEPETDTEAPEGKILGGHRSYMDIWHSAQRAGITFGGFYFVFLKQPGFWLSIWDPEREEKERKTHRKI